MGSQKDDDSTRLRVVIVSLSTRYRVCPLKLVSVFAILLTIGVGNVWGGTTTYTSRTSAGTDTKKIESTDSWVASAGATYNASGAYWACNQASKTITITCTNISDPITEIVVSGKRNKTFTYSISATVGGSTFGTTFTKSTSGDYTTNTLSNATGMSGTVVLTLTSAGAASQGGSLWVGSITVTTKTSTYTVTYDGNGKSSGSVPTDATAYTSGSTVTVKSNTGSLAKTGWTFAGWNTAADGSGTTYAAGSGTFSISANTTLYAKWTCTVTWSVNGATNVYSAQTITYNSSGSKVSSVPAPNPASYCGDKFVGWTTEENVSQDDDTDLNLFTTVASSPNLNSSGSVTFYAVFADYDE